MLLLIRPPHSPTLFPYTTLFRSQQSHGFAERHAHVERRERHERVRSRELPLVDEETPEPEAADHAHESAGEPAAMRSEEHTSELQSPYDLVCRLLLEKKKRVDYI